MGSTHLRAPNYEQRTLTERERGWVQPNEVNREVAGRYAPEALTKAPQSLYPSPPKHSNWKYVPSLYGKPKGGPNQETIMDIKVDVKQEKNTDVRKQAFLDAKKEMSFANLEAHQGTEGEGRSHTERTNGTQPLQRGQKVTVVLKSKYVSQGKTVPASEPDWEALVRDHSNRERDLMAQITRSKQIQGELLDRLHNLQSKKGNESETQILVIRLQSEKEVLERQNWKLLEEKSGLQGERKKWESERGVILREVEDLRQRVSGKESQGSDWMNEKSKYLKQIWEMQQQVRSLQFQLGQVGREKEDLTSKFQFQLRQMQAKKNRFEFESENNRRQLQMERSKNEKTHQKMNKLIFFQDDLIHARDYQKIKDELEWVMAENGKMYEQHQNYIQETKMTRKQDLAALAQLQLEMKKFKNFSEQFRKKMVELAAQLGEEKLLQIKQQNQLKFLQKKCNQQIETILNQEKELGESRSEIQALMNGQKGSNDSTASVLEMNVDQIKDTILLYEARIIDLNHTLQEKQRQIEEQKAEIDKLNGELRNGREQRHINSLKERKNENSLKSDVQNLQRVLEVQRDLNQKKQSNLEQQLQRKGKEIAQKDKFIKEFLISRAKNLGEQQAEDILLGINSYFLPPPIAP